MRFLYCFSYFRLVSVNSFFGSCLSSSTSHLLMQNSSAFFLNSESDWRRKWQPTLLLLSEKFHGWRSLVGYSSWDHRVRHDWATSLTHSRVRQVFRLAGMAFTENGRKARSCPPGVLSVFFASHTFHVIEMSSIFLNYFSWVFALKEWGRCSSNRPKAASVTRNYFLLRWILPGHNDLPYFCWFYSWFIRDRTSLTLVSTELPCRSVLMKYNVWTDLLFNI